MTAIIPPGFAELIFSFTNDTTTHSSSVTLGIELPGGDVSAAALAGWTTWKDNMTGTALGADWTFQSCQCRSDVGDGIHIAPVVGTGPASSCAANFAVLVKKVTGLRGKPNHGRFYLPAGYAPEGDVDSGGFLNPGLIDAVNENIGAVYDDLTGNPIIETVRILHTQAGLAPTVITSFQCEPLGATQRRRMR